jgi:molecular chaperone GrpE (heat shock protein)
MANPNLDKVKELITLSEKAETLRPVLEKFANSVLATWKQLQANLEAYVRAQLEPVKARLAEHQAEIQALLKTSGEDTRKELSSTKDALNAALEDVRLEIPELPDFEGMLKGVERKIPRVPTAAELRDALETLGFEKKAIRGFEEFEKEPERIDRQSKRIIAPSRGVFLFIDGLKKGIVSNLNIVGSGGVTASYSKVNGQDTLTLTASGNGVTVETPTGTVNASNTVFTVTAEPKWVVADGVTYYDGAGYTYAALTITMDVAPSAAIRAII